MVAISRNSFLPSPFAFAASRRRWSSVKRRRRPQLLPKNAVLLAQVVDHLQLTLIHPPRNSDQEEPEWIKHGAHMIGYYRVARILNKCRRIMVFEFSDPTGREGQAYRREGCARLHNGFSRRKYCRPSFQSTFPT